MLVFTDNVHKESRTIKGTRWGNANDLEIKKSPSSLARITLDVIVLPGDEETVREIKRQCQTLYNTHAHGPSYYAKKFLHGFPSRPRQLLVTKGSSGRWLSFDVLIVLTIFLLGWPYRIIMRCITGHVHQVMTKYIYIREGGIQNGININQGDHEEIVVEVSNANEQTPLLA